MFRFSILFSLIISLLACSKTEIPQTTICEADSVFTSNPDHPKAAAIQTKLDEYVDLGLPGVTLLINDDNGFWIAAAGMADIENTIEMQPCHINKLGSVTKMMMGALLWQLIQDGTLNIDAPISNYLPNVAANLEHGEDITIAMLVNHSSGIPDIGRNLAFNLAVINDFTRSWTSEEILEFIDGVPATHEPGEAVRYSNTNTMLTGMVIEAATGEKHSKLLQERIFEPLGMEHTVYYNYATDFPLPHLAQGYLDFYNDGLYIQNVSNLNPGSGNGYTGVYSTVTDLYRFMNALMREKTLTTPENLDLILSTLEEVEWGGWKSTIGGIHEEYLSTFPDENVHCYGHTGGDVGYSANLSYFPHNNTVFAATYNYGTNLPTELGDTFRDWRRELMAIVGE